MRVVVAVVVSLVVWPATTAWALPGTVYLENGGWVQGDVIEVLPGEHVTVRGSDGAMRQIPWAEVERVDQDQAATAAPAAAAPEPAAPEAQDAAAPARPIEPASPAPRRAVLSLNDPNTHRVVLTVEDTKIYLLGLPRSDASSVALRLERLVREAQLAECKEVVITIDGTPSRHPLRHKLGVGRFATTETVQAQLTIDLIELMARARSTELDLCGKKRALTVVHRAPVNRFVKEFKSLVGKPPIVHTASGFDSESPRSAAPFASASLGDLERERGNLGLGGPITLTVAGGVLALNGAVLMIYMLAVGSEEEQICDQALELGVDTCDRADTTPFVVLGGVALGLGVVGLAVGVPWLSSRIKERRELGQRIKQLRRDGRSRLRLPSDGPRLARSTPVLTLHF